MFLSLVDIGSSTHFSYDTVNLCMKLYIYGWFNTVSIVGDLISLTNSHWNEFENGSDTILRSEL